MKRKRFSKDLMGNLFQKAVGIWNELSEKVSDEKYNYNT